VCACVCAEEWCDGSFSYKKAGAGAGPVSEPRIVVLPLFFPVSLTSTSVTVARRWPGLRARFRNRFIVWCVAGSETGARD